ncbi:disease resistance protein (TIR-NBS-LRR class) [Artemisia annua]|uniref:Disease resistance protein (TIR-NBS-LRR class) n=1 Tax=Artemisia annua TaxID=35608 RepID=A0A2U1PIG8_ARTAN|nr:disease resistance protein (TIR-NBS-LRR class) [Artemisia annua]
MVFTNSTSSVQKSFKHDVFLSFRGEDTRNKFVSHLYKALVQNGIQTYKDDENVEKGKTIGNQLMESIEDSRFFIIVFSKDYAGSSWCLDELVKIMECRKASEQTAYPVFYDVEPMEIRNQSGAVKEAFKKHENKEAAGKWRKTLKEAADLAGWESKKTANGDESKLIQIIVDDFFKKICSSSPSVDKKLVGMETRIEAFLSSLELDAPGVRIIGIWGMGGGGKTTLAKAVFDRISTQFDGKVFVENVRDVSKSSSGLKTLQQQVLSCVLSNKNITVNSVHEGTNMMKKMISGRKVLIVLDDVDDIEQLEALAGEPDWFKSGSRVIITTRDKQVLSAHPVNFINNVNLLSHVEAISLFSKYAFAREIPNQGYEELSRQVAKYADGLPLSIKVLGSMLYGQNEPQWIDTLERLKKIPLKETIKKLELSYDDLEEDYKEIFLDVACLLKSWYKDDAIIALESCGFFAQVGLRILEQKSLITISEDGWLGMHDHIEEMGKNIVRRVNRNKPERHSRLWIDEEIEEILANDSGTQATQCITLNAFAAGLNFEILMNGLANMKELRFLHVYAQYVSKREVSKWNFDEDSLHLPNALRFLSWRGYPFSSLPKTFQANNLVGLDIYYSKMVQLWKDGEEKACLKLRFLNFTYSHRLRTLDLSVAPNIETLILEHCWNLVEVHFQVTPNLKELLIYDCISFEKLHMPAVSPKLISLNLTHCLKMRNLHLGITPNLETLRLTNCTDMVELCMPVECPKLVTLHLYNNAKLRSLHIGITPNLETLSLSYCANMVELHMPAECSKLVNLDLSNLKLGTLHLGITPNLEKLSLSDCTHMVELHMPAECPKLMNLDLSNLNLKTLHLGINPNLETLNLRHCTDMVELAECPELVNLDLSNLNLRTLHHLITPNLETLSLKKCTDMVELRMPAECPKLVNLILSSLKLRTLDLGLTPNLESLSLEYCYDLEEINAPAECLKKLLDLNISHCGRFESFKFDKKLDSPKVVSLSELHLFALKRGACDPGNTWPEFQFQCDYKEDPASSFGNLERLISLGFGAHIKVDSFSDIICGLQCLRKLTLVGDIPEAPKNLDRLDCLEELSLQYTNIKTLPDSICMLKLLKSLEIKSCCLLERLPEDIGRLKCLERLFIMECALLRDIPSSICEMKRLKLLDLFCCIQVEKLPEEFGHLKCLKALNIQGTCISHLPQSIFGLKGLRIVGDKWLLESCGLDQRDKEYLMKILILMM